jgi:hypothetical protein
MGVSSVKELSRKAEYEVGQVRKLTREWVCVLTDDTLTGAPLYEPDVFTAVGVDLGSIHPTYTDGPYRCRKMTLTEGFEGSPYHVHLVAEYGIIAANELTTPLDRSAVWEFGSQPGEIPALAYLDGTTLRPLTNSAYDYFPGLVTQESTAVATVQKNFATFPSSWFSAMNHVNNAQYLGCPTHSVKVQQVKVSTAREQFLGSVISYWSATAELHYRQSGHNLQLPDIGWNFIDGGQKRRAMVFDFENSEWIASPNPVGLDGNGGLTLSVPAILNRRVNPEANFSSIFGTPPSTPLPV